MSGLSEVQLMEGYHATHCSSLTCHFTFDELAAWMYTMHPRVLEVTCHVCVFNAARTGDAIVYAGSWKLSAGREARAEAADD
jgi:hypothetical protein